MTRATRPLVAALLCSPSRSRWLAPAPSGWRLPRASPPRPSTDLTLVTDATYTVQPSKSRVHVAMSVDARNHRGETRTHKYYFDHAFLAVQPGASGFARHRARRAPRSSVAQRSKNATLLRINFGAACTAAERGRCSSPSTSSTRASRSSRQVRVGSGLVTFPVWAFASDGARGSRVQVRFPAGYAIDVESGGVRQQDEDRGRRDAPGDPAPRRAADYFAYLSAQKDPVFKETPLAVAAGDDQVDLLLRGWRDDPAWSARVGTLFRKSLPRLSNAIGLAWPQAGQTVVQEAVSRTAGGYAGLFSPADRRIEVAYWADPLVVLHEAAHGWFNGGLVADRWASEGFASYYAQRVAGALKVRDTSPKISASVSLAAIPLNAWPNTTGAGGVRWLRRQRHGHVGRPGDGGLRVRGLARAGPRDRRACRRRRHAPCLGRRRRAHRRLPAAAAGTAGATGGTGSASATLAPETVDGPPDWRGLLDLLEAETGKDFTDLWRQWVVRPEEAGLLDARAEARTAYVRTLASTGDWQLPRSHPRRPARLAVRHGRPPDGRRSRRCSRCAARSSRSPREAGSRCRRSCNSASRRATWPRASREAESERNAMLGVMQAAAARSSDDDVLSRIGMIGAGPRGGPRRREAGGDRRRRGGGPGPRRRRVPGVDRGLAGGPATGAARDGRPRRGADHRVRRRGPRARRSPGTHGVDRRRVLTDVRAKGVVRPALAGLVLAAGLSVLAGLVPPAAGPAFLASPLGAVAPAVALAADDLGVTTKTHYVVAPDAGVVHVTVDVTALNQKPNRSTSGVITRYFYNQVNLGVQLEATHVKASRGGTALPRDHRQAQDLPARDGRARVRPVLRRDDARPHPVRPAGRPAALGEQRPGRAGLRDVPRVGVRRPGERADRRAGVVRRRRVGRGHDEGRRRERQPGVHGIDRRRHRLVCVGQRPQRQRPHARAPRPARRRADRRPRLARGHALAPSRVGDPVRQRAQPRRAHRAPMAGRRAAQRARGAHPAPRGVRRLLRPEERRDHDQREPRRRHDHPRGVARLVQRQPVHGPLDQRGPRRGVRLARARVRDARQRQARRRSSRRPRPRSRSAPGRRPRRSTTRRATPASSTATTRRGR